MNIKPALGQRVRLTNNRALRAPVSVGSIGICVGDYLSNTEMVWVKFIGVDCQTVNWKAELGEVK